MEALERIEAKLDLILQRLQEEDAIQETHEDAKPVRKRVRYNDEISNTAMSASLNVEYIGNKEFCRVADRAGIKVSMHGTHPYIKRACKDLWIKVWKGED